MFPKHTQLVLAKLIGFWTTILRGFNASPGHRSSWSRCSLRESHGARHDHDNAQISRTLHDGFPRHRDLPISSGLMLVWLRDKRSHRAVNGRIAPFAESCMHPCLSAATILSTT